MRYMIYSKEKTGKRFQMVSLNSDSGKVVPQMETSFEFATIFTDEENDLSRFYKLPSEIALLSYLRTEYKDKEFQMRTVFGRILKK